MPDFSRRLLSASFGVDSIVSGIQENMEIVVGILILPITQSKIFLLPVSHDKSDFDRRLTSDRFDTDSNVIGIPDNPKFVVGIVVLCIRMAEIFQSSGLPCNVYSRPSLNVVQY